MSRRSLTIAFLLPILTSAQQFGTKKDVLAATGGATAPSMMPLLQMLVALGIVFGLLKFALPKVAGKLNKRLVTGVNSTIRIEESANFAGGSLYIVTAREKTLLLSVGTSGVNCVADLTPALKAPEQPLFDEFLKASLDAPVLEPTPAQPDATEIQRALDRLTRLTANV